METSTKPSSGFDASHFKEASMLKPSSNKKEERSSTSRRKPEAVQRRIRERKIYELMSLEESKDYPKYATHYVLRFPGLEIEKDLNAIGAEMEIKNKIGQPRKMTLMKNTKIDMILSEQTLLFSVLFTFLAFLNFCSH